MNEPILTQHLTGLSFRWDSLSLTLTLSRIREDRSETKAELTVTNQAGVLTHQSFNLLAGRTRSQLAKELQAKHALSAPSWETILETVCVRGLLELRKGNPIQVLEPHDQPNVPFLINPLVYQKHQTLIYADGGSLKSYIALYLALLACHGATQNGLSALSCPTLILDYELDAETTGTRLNRLYHGHPELAQYAPYYRACHHPLHEEIELLSQEISEKGIQLVIIDSAIMACGDDLNSTEAPRRMGRALRHLGCASIVLSHCAKNGDMKTAYGSVFFKNLCRNQYELELVDETEQEKRVTLTHRKTNFGAFQPPKGIAFNFADGACRVSAFDPMEEADAPIEHLPLPAKIRNLLEDGMPRTTGEIAQTLTEKPEHVRVTLHRLDRRKWIKLPDNRWTVLQPSRRP